MTTDPFTEAASDAAREYARTPRMNVGSVRDRLAMAHEDGWEAARTHLAAQEPTDAEVEAVAEVVAESEDTGSIETARAALAAAKEATR